VTAFFDMLRLRKLPTCIKVGGPLGCNVRMLKPEPFSFSLVLTSNGCGWYCFASLVSTYLLEVSNKFAKGIGPASRIQCKKVRAL
jgi:hypothetical protein